ncbi:MAG: hypothetical protein JWM28_364 [Chitinophagaceae bacterium]|nr:hypothetical protein [Chitinophagaceae bacterium]
MRKRLPGKIVCLYCVLFYNGIAAQNKLSDSSLLNSSLQQVINIHNQTLGENIHLYNGPQNAGYNHLSTGHPYFIADEVQPGSVFYDGILYRGVLMLYDLEQDNAVIVRYNNENISEEYRNILRMDLIRNQVGWFTLPGHEFVRLEADSNSRDMKDGFYDRVYNGKIKVFIKRTKKHVEEVKGSELERRYDAHDFYYIQKSGIYYNIKTKKSVLQLFKDKKKELAAFTRKNKLKFKRNKEGFITELSRYYDQLIN